MSSDWLSYYLIAKTAPRYIVLLVVVISRFGESPPWDKLCTMRIETLRWILWGLLIAFGIVALITMLSVRGFLAIGAILFNPFILVVLGIAIVVIAAMMKNKKDVR